MCRNTGSSFLSQVFGLDQNHFPGTPALGWYADRNTFMTGPSDIAVGSRIFLILVLISIAFDHAGGEGSRKPIQRSEGSPALTLDHVIAEALARNPMFHSDPWLVCRSAYIRHSMISFAVGVVMTYL